MVKRKIQLGIIIKCVLSSKWRKVKREKGGTYIFIMVECVEHVVRKARKEINDEPRFKIIHSNNFGFGDNFTSRSHKSSVEVKNNVDEEDDVDDGVNYEKTHILGCFVLKGNVVRHHNSCVES